MSLGSCRSSVAEARTPQFGRHPFLLATEAERVGGVIDDGDAGAGQYPADGAAGHLAQFDLARAPVDEDGVVAAAPVVGEDHPRLGRRGAGGEGDLHAVVVGVQLRPGQQYGYVAGQGVHE